MKLVMMTCPWRMTCPYNKIPVSIIVPLHSNTVATANQAISYDTWGKILIFEKSHYFSPPQVRYIFQVVGSLQLTRPLLVLPVGARY
jgi:hypothetical protein